MNAIAIRPTVMNVMPMPLRAAGTFEYDIFYLMAASVTIARNQPIPEPRAYTVASPTLTKSFCCMKSAPPRIAQFTAISGRKIPSDE